MKHPVAAVEGAYSRLSDIDRTDIFITLRDRAESLDDAERVAARLARGDDLPLAGMIAVVKDNIDVAGLPTTSAAPWTAHIPERDAAVVARLREAGAVIIGKTNMDQFATGLVGTRSPHGKMHSALDATRVSGGSSSGSAVAVALGIADIGLGTDTAGSGRVPAAFNGIIGVKPTLGLLPTAGVVPACPSYDTVSVFARDLDVAAIATRVMAGTSASRTRHERPSPSSGRLGAPRHLVLAVPRQDDLEALDPEWRRAFAAAVEEIRLQGAQIREVDISPMLEAAALLYDGALVAERYAGFGRLLDPRQADADPAVAQVLAGADQVPAHELVRDQHRLMSVRAEMTARLAGVAGLLVPTTTHHPTLAEVEADLVGVNARLGTYTNFVNPLDLCAIALPYLPRNTGAPGFGLTVIADAFEDQVVLDIAHRILGTEPREPVDGRGVLLLAVGAHMRDLPLEGDLASRGARFEEAVRTAPEYTLVAVPGEPPRPGMLPAAEGTGVSVEGELWRIGPAGLGDLLSTLPPALSLGAVTLEDGRRVIGFRADPVLVGGAQDISSYGGWRRYLQEVPG